MSNIDFSTLKPGDVGKLSKDEVQAYIAYLTETKAAAEAAKEASDAKVKAIQAEQAETISFKVGVRGGLSVYGLGQYPLNAYKGQWMRLLDGVETVREGSTFARFLEALKNPELSTGKDDTRYKGEALDKRIAKAEAERSAKKAGKDVKPEDSTKPRLAPASAS